uniref:Upper collar protein n=1 Tax=Podoviridae sp. ctack17 TaxID=2825260 RepID=A0A8S5PYD2_9CAUD|nr:MAG TPA: upper collar protein [Podoviridae sp. ctack17]
MSRNKHEIEAFKIKNYKRLYDYYKMLALNMFTWENLPETMDSRYIENALYEHGLCLVNNDNDLGLISVPCSFGANMNINGESTEVITSGYNYIKTVKYINNDDCTLIRNNDLAKPTRDYIANYAERMLEVEMCIRANINQQKFPWFINASEKTKKSLELIFDKVENFEPFILANREIMGENPLEVLTMPTPYVADKLNSYKYELEREILSFLSLNNNFEKKERLLTDEVNSNNDFIHTNAMLMYKNRLQACEQINKKFGLNVRVLPNREMISKYYVDEEEEEKGVEDNE